MLDKRIRMVYITILYVSTIISLILIYKNPASGYEISIYTSSMKEIIFLIFSSLGAISYIIYSIFSKKLEKNFLVIVFFLILINDFIISSLAGLRGYVIHGDGDFLTHLGYVTDILLEGQSRNLIYPASHVLIANISLITNIPAIQLTKYISQLFFTIYVLLIYILSKKVFDNQIQVILIVLSSFVFIFSGFETEFKPQFLSIITVPMFLYFLFRSSFLGMRFLLILLVILIQFFHPLTSIFSIISITLIMVYFLIKKIRLKEEINQNINRHNFYHFNIYEKYKGCKHISSVAIISFILWISNFQYMLDNITNKLDKWIRGDVSPPVHKVGNSFIKLSMTRFEIIDLVIRMFGNILIFVTISVIFILLYLKFEEKKDSIDILIILFISGIIIQIITATGGLSLTITRGLNYVMVITPIFVGSFLYKLQLKNKGFVIGTIILFIISSAWIIGIFSVYTSPYIRQPNDQVTKTEIYGANWFFKYKNPDIRFIGGHIGTRFSHLILGVDETYTRRDNPVHLDYMLPDHFNYDKISRLGMSFAENIYMPISNYDRLLYIEGPWKPVGRFSNQDYDNLTNDTSINNLYDNGAMNIYYISVIKN